MFCGRCLTGLCPFLAAVVIKVRKKGSSNLFFFLKNPHLFFSSFTILVLSVFFFVEEKVLNLNCV